MTPAFLAGPTDGRLELYEHTDHDAVTLEEDIIFRDSRGVVWIAPAGLDCDGASIPRILWTAIGHPLQARHLPAAALHDQSYQTGFRLTIDPDILPLVMLDEMTPAEICALPRVEVLVDRAEVDRFALYEPLRATIRRAPGGSGEPMNTFAHARVVFRGVHVAGWVAWNGHVKRRVAERVPFSRCR